MGRFKLKKI